MDGAARGSCISRCRRRTSVRHGIIVSSTTSKGDITCVDRHRKGHETILSSSYTLDDKTVM